MGENMTEDLPEPLGPVTQIAKPFLFGRGAFGLGFNGMSTVTEGRVSLISFGFSMITIAYL
eukprot:SAG25_NODE_7676_length_467_cov_0.298913_1_plen_61_part_00